MSVVARQAHSQAVAFEAACIAINLAAADEATTQAILPAAPLIIALLGGGRGPAVAEHCAWALGESLLCWGRVAARSIQSHSET